MNVRNDAGFRLLLQLQLAWGNRITGKNPVQ